MRAVHKMGGARVEQLVVAADLQLPALLPAGGDGVGENVSRGGLRREVRAAGGGTEKLGVEEWAGFVAGPEVGEDDDAGDCGVGAPEGSEGVALEGHDGEENDEICCAEDDHHSDF